MKDIAAATGVSRSTVSRILNDAPLSVPIAQETRDRVLIVARELGYRPSPLPRALRGGPTRLSGRGGPAILDELREQVLAANLALVQAGLVTLTFGNASGVNRDAGVLVIKPSGVPYAALRPADLVAVDLETGTPEAGGYRPSSDTPT